MIRAKSCTVCGRRTPDGGSRCPKHTTGSGRNQPCMVCGRSTSGKYCNAHEPTVDEALRQARHPYRADYSTAEYRRNRQHRLERARGRCEDCGRRVISGQYESDHVIPVRIWRARNLPGSPNALDNLRIRCIIPRDGAPRGCHGLKTATDRKNR